jgi:serine/threonine protein kinase
MKKPNKIEKEYLVVKRKTELCYYVMKLAEYGELYSFIENTEPFNEHMTRYLLDQLLEAICYLHSHGIVHRDIKPENILINKKGKLIIADFSFATRMQEEDSDNILKKKFDPIIEMRHNVGSEIYNAPELWDN